MKNSYTTPFPLFLLIFFTCLCLTFVSLSGEPKKSGGKPPSSSALGADIQRDRATTEVQKTIEGLMQALRDHDISKAYYAFTTRTFRTNTSRDGFQTFVLSNPVLSKNVTAPLMEPSFQNEMIVVKGVLTSIDNQRSIVEFALVIEDGQWKILGMKVFPPAKTSK